MSTAPSPAAPRVAAIDAYRGLVMFLMMAEVLRLGRIGKALPDSPFWQFLAHHQSHVEWAGCSLHDLIQPSFSFLVGAALPFSLAARAPADWHHNYNYTGFAAHWNKNSNLAWAFDTWFLNLFPRDKPFLFNSGGYATLSFIPTLGTMILGLISGDRLRRGDPGRAKVGWFVVTGAACLALGLAADEFGLCPSVKRIWTPSWVLVSGGWCFLFLAGFYAALDVLGWRAWSYPLRVIGRNSIAAYVMAHLWDDFVVKAFQTHFGRDVFQAWGPAYQTLLSGAAILTV